jgi:hypothetical protein
MRTQNLRGQFAVASLIAILSAVTAVKLGSLQAEDVLLVFLLGFCVAKYLCSGFSFRISERLSGLSKSYGLLLFVLLLISLFAFRLTFYPLDETSYVKQPAIFSLSKLLQFAATVCGFLWLTNMFLIERRLVTRAMTAYWRLGIVSSWFAILSWVVVAVAHIDPSSLSGAVLGAYSVEYAVRARGFFNEGGPFGLYIVSVFAIGVLRRHMTGRRLGLTNIAFLSTAFLFSESKAAFFVAVLLILYSVLSAASFRKKVTYFVLSTAILCGAAAWQNLPSVLVGYYNSYLKIEDNAGVLGRDPNLVLGRVAASFIVPRMIAAHPITGIGIGNYSLMRNDPHYLGSLPAVTDAEDLPGIGIPGIAAEMGIPATIWLLVLLCRPYWVCRKKAPIIGIAAIFQPIAHLFGVQLTFFYPWFVSACALAACYEPDEYRTKRQRSPSAVPPRLVTGPTAPILSAIHGAYTSGRGDWSALHQCSDAPDL